jgi:hypothetical protein
MMNGLFNKILVYFRNNPKAYSYTFKMLKALLFAFAAYYCLIIIVLPVMNYEFMIPDHKDGNPERDFKSYDLISNSFVESSGDLAFREAFLLSRLETAQNDTMAVALDLFDSTVTLMIQGMPVHTIRVTGYEVSKIFDKIDPVNKAYFFSWPFRIEEYSSSVPKVPVIVRKAPGDTIEAASLPEPGHLEENHYYVAFQFKLERKLSLMFEQDSISGSVLKKTIRKYRYHQKSEKKKSINSALIRAGPYEYLPEIKIKLNRSDALVLFRAIPDNANIAIRISPH